jgi:hypothetical protein
MFLQDRRQIIIIIITIIIIIRPLNSSYLKTKLLMRTLKIIDLNQGVAGDIRV